MIREIEKLDLDIQCNKLSRKRVVKIILIIIFFIIWGGWMIYLAVGAPMESSLYGEDIDGRDVNMKHIDVTAYYDTIVVEYEPDISHGSNTSMTLYASYSTCIFVRFDISGLSTMSVAWIDLYIPPPANYRVGYDIYLVSDRWDETLTWNDLKTNLAKDRYPILPKDDPSPDRIDTDEFLQDNSVIVKDIYQLFDHDVVSLAFYNYEATIPSRESGAPATDQIHLRVYYTGFLLQDGLYLVASSFIVVYVAHKFYRSSRINGLEYRRLCEI